MAFLLDKSIYCIPNETMTSKERYIIGAICIPSSIIGFLGASLLAKSLWKYRNRERRTFSVNPSIIFNLAVADLVSCFGILSLAICLMVFEVPLRKGYDPYIPRHGTLYESIGTTLEVVTLFAYVASYIWTLSYALDTFFQTHSINCSMIVYHILSWCTSLLIVAIVQIMNYVKCRKYCEQFYTRKSRLILTYLPMVAVIVINPVLLALTYRRVEVLLRRGGSYIAADRISLNKCKMKFFWMVFIFGVCWFPSIVSISYDLVTLKPDQREKSPLDNLWFLEAFLNPLQGILNYIVYRKSFRVHPTDIGNHDRGRLPPVSKEQSEQWVQEYERRTSKHKETQSIESSPGNSVKETPERSLLLRKSTRDTVSYFSRLLGE